jgi:hypothetical protein
MRDHQDHQAGEFAVVTAPVGTADTNRNTNGAVCMDRSFAQRNVSPQETITGEHKQKRARS